MSALRIPVPRSHAPASHQDFAIVGQIHLAPRQHFANRSLPQTKWMIHADQRGRLGKPVALNHGIAQPVPEFLRLAIERRPARDHRPKFPSKLSADRAKRPPASQEMLRLRCQVSLTKRLNLPLTLEFPL